MYELNKELNKKKKKRRILLRKQRKMFDNKTIETEMIMKQ